MSGNPFFSGRIPKELDEHIENFRRESGESKTEILIRALSAYTGFSLPKTKVKLDNPLLNRITKLEETVNRLSELDELKIKISELEQIINSNKNNNKNENLPLPRDDNNNENQSDNKWEILQTKDVAKRIKISDSTLRNWNRNNLLPKTENGYIIDYSHKKRENGSIVKMFFKIKKII
ncbi:hypothetical protein [Cyanobacterium aponinum]|uniref:hypothetical protein n=1 Tax=Cyanobacterium aponinum TaxID=379064 RepID=UPI000C12DF74|nr:hypothetical protein [Cyanobacterium aponinum]PHV60997.1 hypothetical protein CSQ80_17955 [Cyanobacterium aponinum IPPAS B-1201]